MVTRDRLSENLREPAIFDDDVHVVRNVVSAADEGFVQHYVAMLESFVRYNDATGTTFYLLSTALSPDTQRLRSRRHQRRLDLRLLDVRNRLSGPRGPKVSHHVASRHTFASLSRRFCPKPLPGFCISTSM